MVAKHLNEFCKKNSTFQKETSVDGYVHWQGRVITKKQLRKTEIISGARGRGGCVTDAPGPHTL